MRRTIALALAVLLPPLAAQEMIAVDWTGTLHTLDPFTGATSVIGATGLTGHNALAVDGDCTVWTTDRSPGGSGYAYGLVSLDLSTGAGTRVHANAPDLRGLAGDGSGRLWGIEDGQDWLVTIDVATGAVTRIGATASFIGVQSLEWHDGRLFAWDIHRGLVTIDPATGQPSPVDPVAGAGVIGGDIQFLATRSDGALVGGGRDLYVLDTVLGTATLIGPTGGADLRGAENRAGLLMPFGTGCGGPAGPSVLATTGVPQPGSTLGTRSTNHAPSAPGVMILGLSRREHLGLPLPWDLDPIFGTSGCSLWVSIDLTVAATTSSSAPANLRVNLPLPPALRCPPLNVQHVSLVGASGRTIWSNGVEIRLGF